ncbi:hypothetical protein FC83_GL001489 [Agrilactobacillus composti DSM 18527 = JCM 14202]|uniref:Surface layer protein A domain-containing protein n=1 Tax=Agrilactobacillus composti DSM 18527 = JCM 14202 TaxID=1423734 RepID=X0PU33_9LACO|nr:hypothetical protein [Agrilactobacillus composti]KRM30928.1 hypothetical protein FC83_GL001489 [Agrilactobacillus composti DSM 18527 = JCM 14202]GAF40871.1 hypothetical protein JCM14202_2781 [Agrilactobacillus composti DSM 18527 = JCM 14202]
MKNEKQFVKLFVILGALFLGLLGFKANIALAALDIQVPMNPTTVTSNGFPAVVYSDPACTKPTGQTLDKTITTWKVNREVFAYPSNNFFGAFDLGDNQWVKDGEVFFHVNPISVDRGRYDILEAYTDGKQVKVYNNPQLSKVAGNLDTSIQDWAVTGYAVTGPDGSLGRLDLGDNQWVNAKDVVLIYNVYIFKAGTLLYDDSGQQTGTLPDLDGNGYGYYRAFGVMKHNDEFYIRLGSDTQWAKLSQSHRDI